MLTSLLLLILGLFFPELIILCLGTSIGAFVTGIISMALQKRKPHYHLGCFGIAGFVIGLVFMLAFIIGLILIIMW